MAKPNIKGGIGIWAKNNTGAKNVVVGYFRFATERQARSESEEEKGSPVMRGYRERKIVAEEHLKTKKINHAE